MANSKTLLVYALALVVCAGSWAAANTVPVHSRDTFQARVASSPHYQKSQQPLPQSPQAAEETLQKQYQPKSDELPASHVQQQQPGAAPPNNAPPTMTLKNGFGFSAGNSRNGPYASGYGYLSGGRNLQSQPPPSSQTPPSVYMTDYDVIEQSPRPNRLTDIESFTPIPSAMSALVPHISDFGSILFGAMLGYAGHQVGFGDKFAGFFPGLRRLTRYFFGYSEPVVKEAEKKTAEKEKVEKIAVKSEKEAEKTPTKNSHVEKSETATTKEAEKAETENKEVSKVEHREPAAATNSTENHRRRKRDVEVDTDLTQLATMVLTAVQSGECMQRSICLLGNQIGTSSRGRTAFSLVDKLIPESVQGNQYFVTLKKALRGGDSFCDRFHCKLH